MAVVEVMEVVGSALLFLAMLRKLVANYWDLQHCSCDIRQEAFEPRQR